LKAHFLIIPTAIKFGISLVHTHARTSNISFEKRSEPKVARWNCEN
jgi:hypothetical protein